MSGYYSSPVEGEHEDTLGRMRYLRLRALRPSLGDFLCMAAITCIAFRECYGTSVSFLRSTGAALVLYFFFVVTTRLMRRVHGEDHVFPHI